MNYIANLQEAIKNWPNNITVKSDFYTQWLDLQFIKWCEEQIELYKQGKGRLN